VRVMVLVVAGVRVGRVARVCVMVMPVSHAVRTIRRAAAPGKRVEGNTVGGYGI